MNTLIIHSAQSTLIKKLINQLAQDSIFVLTFPRNKGLFATNNVTEVYFQKDQARIDAIKVAGEVREIVREKNINRIIGVYSNVYGSNYENLRVLLSLLDAKEKVIYNRDLKKVDSTCLSFDMLAEMYYENENFILPLLTSEMLKVRRANTSLIGKVVKKIMFVNNTYTVGGVENLLLQWGKYLSTHYEVVTVCDTNGGLLEKYQKSKIKAYVARPDVFDEPCVLSFYFYLKKIMEEEKPNAVIIAGADTIIPATMAAVTEGIPFIFKINNGTFNSIQNSKPVGMQLKLFAPLYNRLIAVSNSVKENMMELGVPGESIEVVYGSSVSTQEFDKVTEISELVEKGKKNFVCVSRLSPEKGVDVFLRAVARLEDKVRNQSSFLVVGDGPEKTKLLDLCRELEIEHIVKFVGNQNNVASILKGTYMTVLSSHTEGLPLVLLESMATGVPCIASRVGGVPEVIKNNENGFIFEDNDHVQLANIINFCIEHKDKIELIRKEARKTIADKFDISCCLGDLEKLFTKCLS